MKPTIYYEDTDSVFSSDPPPPNPPIIPCSGVAGYVGKVRTSAQHELNLLEYLKFCEIVKGWKDAR
jgi:hypothetical protein